MKTYHITKRAYEAMAERADERPNGVAEWVELPDGCAICFDIRNGKPVGVEVLDVDDNEVTSDYSRDEFARVYAAMYE